MTIQARPQRETILNSIVDALLGLWSGVFELPSERRRLRRASAGL